MEDSVLQSGSEIVRYNGSDTEYSARLTHEYVTVHCNIGTHTQGSSKMKLENRIDYNWEFQYYSGQLIAAHMNSDVIAYGIKNGDGGMVRVVNQRTDKRTLIKNRRKEVRDIAFSFSHQKIILGYTDDEGSVWIYEILDSPSDITYNLLLQVYHETPISDKLNFRIIWCPCSEDTGDSVVVNGITEEPSQMFAVLNDNSVEIWNYGVINSQHKGGPLAPNPELLGYAQITHTTSIVDAAFASDGTAVAIATEDGYVKFFQLFIMENQKLQFLHEWNPDPKLKLSSIVFVDNLLETNSCCWRFMITAFNNNSEIKLWSCETWKCLQTIKFRSHPDSVVTKLFLKMALDITGKFLILSDMNHKALYVLELQRFDDVHAIRVGILSQFLLPASFISFHILTARKRKRLKAMSECSSSEDDVGMDQVEDMLRTRRTRRQQLPTETCGSDGSDLESHSPHQHADRPDQLDDVNEDVYDYQSDQDSSVYIQMLVIQHKRFQECKLYYNPMRMLIMTHTPVSSTSNVEQNIENIRDECADTSAQEMETAPAPKLEDLEPSVKLLIQKQQQMDLLSRSAMSLRHSSSTDLAEADDNMNANMVSSSYNRAESNVQHSSSSGSSPSREVEEILSLTVGYESKKDIFESIAWANQKADEEQAKNLVCSSNFTPPLLPTDVSSQQSNGDANGAYGPSGGSVSILGRNNMWPKIPRVSTATVRTAADPGCTVVAASAVAGASILSNVSSSEPQCNTVNRDRQLSPTSEVRLNNLERMMGEMVLSIQRLQKDVHAIGEHCASQADDMKNIQTSLNKEQLQTSELCEAVGHLRNNLNRDLVAHSVAKSVSQLISDKLATDMRNLVIANTNERDEQWRAYHDVQYKTLKLELISEFKECMRRRVTDQVIGEAVSATVAAALEPVLEKTYRHMMTQELLPRMERLCNNMFKQINDSFALGTQEYMAAVESRLERSRRNNDNGPDVIAQLQTASERFQETSDKFSQVITAEMHRQLKSTSETLQNCILTRIRDLIIEQFRNHRSQLEDTVANAVRSRAPTPCLSGPDVQQRVVTISFLDQLIAQENYEEVFELALSAANLNFVVHVCSKVDADMLFEEHVPAQNIILSLVQQLSVDLSKSTDIQFTYIRAALLALIPDHAETHPFIPKVLKGLIRHLDAFTTTNPPRKYLQDVKLLKMAVQNILDRWKSHG